MADPLLFRPISLRDLEVRNRLWISPMCQYSADADGPGQGVPNDWHQVHWAALARGGTGLITVEATGVTPDGRISPRCLGLWNDAQEAAFARLIPVAQAHGARVGIQLGHAGRKASTYPGLPGQPSGTMPASEGGWLAVAPSAIPFADGFDTPREMTLDEVRAVVTAFRAATDRAKRAGFEFVEVHGAHGYLLHQFLSLKSNQRTDEYGGSAENRARLIREVVQGIRADHPELPIMVRLSGEEWVDGGFDVEAAAELVDWLAADGADFIDASSGGNSVDQQIPVGPSYQVRIAARLRAAALPVGAVGLITTAAQAEGILASGQADIISIGRPALTNPHLPLEWAHTLRAPGAEDLVPPQYRRARF